MMMMMMIILIEPGSILSSRQFVRSFLRDTLCDFSDTKSPVFMKFGTCVFSIRGLARNLFWGGIKVFWEV